MKEHWLIIAILLADYFIWLAVCKSAKQYYKKRRQLKACAQRREEEHIHIRKLANEYLPEYISYRGQLDEILDSNDIKHE
jgi:cell division protein FtsB